MLVKSWSQGVQTGPWRLQNDLPEAPKSALERQKSILALLLLQRSVKKCSTPMPLTYFYRFFVNLGVPFGGDFCFFLYLFSMLIFYKLVDEFLSILGASRGSKIALKSFLMRSSWNRKNLTKPVRVASKSRFAGSEVDAKTSFRCKLRPEKNTCSADLPQIPISVVFFADLGTPNQ